jgi:hypothetical protein
LKDAVFRRFYDKTVTDYVAAWDPDKDGIMESPPASGRLGMPSYYRHDPRSLTGADLIATQYSAYLSYAAMLDQEGDANAAKQAKQLKARAAALRAKFNSEWWDRSHHRYYTALLPDHSFYAGYIAESYIFPLLSHLPDSPDKSAYMVEALEHGAPINYWIESYIPEVLFEHNQSEAAYQRLFKLLDPEVRSSETAFAAVEAVVSGLMGISPDAPQRQLQTCWRLPAELENVALKNLRVGPNTLTVTQGVDHNTTVDNVSGPPIIWQATFPANGEGVHILVDGIPESYSAGTDENGAPVLTVQVPVSPGQTRTAQLKDQIISTRISGRDDPGLEQAVEQKPTRVADRTIGY